MGYKSFDYIYMPDYYSANSEGYVIAQRYYAEQKLGRRLTKHEVVYHIDKNPRNNDPENIMVFRNKTYRDRYKMGDKAVENPDGSFSTVHESPKKICEFCGKPFIPRSKSPDAKYCSASCRYAALQSKNKPTKKHLKELLMELGFAEIAHLYEVNDSTVRSWCAHYGLPSTNGALNKMRVLAQDKRNQKEIDRIRQENRKLEEKLSHLYAQCAEDDDE